MAPPKKLKTQETPAPTAAEGVKQRLVICLDGTWNKRDSGTNIYHLSNLIQEGEVADQWLQRIYYDPGVGTGVLDGVTGGAFGIGLSENVREAYDWLVEHYNDGDEVYIFGFSRGAFTARSLVGLIANAVCCAGERRFLRRNSGPGIAFSAASRTRRPTASLRRTGGSGFSGGRLRLFVRSGSWRRVNRGTRTIRGFRFSSR